MGHSGNNHAPVAGKDGEKDLKATFYNASGHICYILNFSFARAHAGAAIRENPQGVALGMLAHLTRHIRKPGPESIPVSADCIPFNTNEIGTIELTADDDTVAEVTIAEIGKYMKSGERRMGDGTILLNEGGVSRLRSICPQLNLAA